MRCAVKGVRPMKNKAPLALMEQIVMLLVFALAAGLCLQMFVFASRISHRCEARDRAALTVQNAAEVWKMSGGDAQVCAKLLGGQADGDAWQISYDDAWTETSGEAAYTVSVTPIQTEQPLLGCADISAETADGDCLFRVTVSWQEGADG